MLRTLAIGLALALVVFALTGGHVFFLPLLFIPLGLFSFGHRANGRRRGWGEEGGRRAQRNPRDRVYVGFLRASSASGASTKGRRLQRRATSRYQPRAVSSAARRGVLDRGPFRLRNLASGRAPPAPRRDAWHSLRCRSLAGELRDRASRAAPVPGVFPRQLPTCGGQLCRTPHIRRRPSSNTRVRPPARWEEAAFMAL